MFYMLILSIVNVPKKVADTINNEALRERVCEDEDVKLHYYLTLWEV